VEGVITSVARRFGVSHAALNALAVIEGEGKPMLSGEVGARMHITSGSVTALLDNLERKGYVERTSDAADRRRVLVDVTPAAQALLDELLPAVQQVCRNLMDRIGAEREQILLALLDEIRVAVAELPDELPAPERRRRPKHFTR
jgi:DNA-binding MarR family transcriptional regulator